MKNTIVSWKWFSWHRLVQWVRAICLLPCTPVWGIFLQVIFQLAENTRVRHSNRSIWTKTEPTNQTDQAQGKHSFSKKCADIMVSTSAENPEKKNRILQSGKSFEHSGKIWEFYPKYWKSREILANFFFSNFYWTVSVKYILMFVKFVK